MNELEVGGYYEAECHIFKKCIIKIVVLKNGEKGYKVAINSRNRYVEKGIGDNFVWRFSPKDTIKRKIPKHEFVLELLG